MHVKISCGSLAQYKKLVTPYCNPGKLQGVYTGRCMRTDQFVFLSPVLFLTKNLSPVLFFVSIFMVLTLGKF